MTMITPPPTATSAAALGIGNVNLSDDMLRGADAIADFMGMKRRQIYHLTETSRLPVFRVGSVLCARRSTLLGWVEDQELRATAGCGQ